ncbi:hypothetical protein D3C77_423950 [compost metagenome]
MGVGTGAVVDTWQLDFAVFEVHGLANAEALALEAVFFDPAVGHAQRQFVLVTDSVGARETVVAEQRAVVEQGLAAVEDRDVDLVFVWDIEIEQARFEGLAIVLAEPLGVAVEVQTAVNAEDRYVAVLSATETTQKVEAFW